MKNLSLALVLLGAMFSATAATAVPSVTAPSKRDIGEMKRAASFAVEKEYVKTGEPAAIGDGTYEVSVIIASKVCKVILRPSDDDLGPWRWEKASMKCDK